MSRRTYELPEDDTHTWMLDRTRCRFYPNCTLHDGSRELYTFSGYRNRRFTSEQVSYIRFTVWHKDEGVLTKPSWKRYVSELALEFNCSTTTIKKIVRYETYKDLP